MQDDRLEKLQTTPLRGARAVAVAYCIDCRVPMVWLVSKDGAYYFAKRRPTQTGPVVDAADCDRVFVRCGCRGFGIGKDRIVERGTLMEAATGEWPASQRRGLQPCQEPRCPALVQTGRDGWCDEHRPADIDHLIRTRRRRGNRPVRVWMREGCVVTGPDWPT